MYSHTAPTGAITDIYFTVLPFISGTCEPVLCFIIFKSEQDIKDIPLKGKLGINLTAEGSDAAEMEKSWKRRTLHSWQIC
jgi:hypothetical protein